MFKKRTERILEICIYILNLCIISLVYPYQVTPIVQYQACMHSLILLVLCTCIYRSLRNRIVIDKIRALQETNNYSAYLNYINSCLHVRKDLFWLHCEKMIMFAQLGQYSDFQSYLMVVEKSKFYNKRGNKKYRTIISNYRDMFIFLQQGELKSKQPECNDNTFNLLQMNNLITSLNFAKQKPANYDELIFQAHALYNSPYRINKTIAAIVLTLLYDKDGDVENKYRYEKKACELSPSQEVTDFFNNLINKYESKTNN